MEKLRLVQFFRLLPLVWELAGAATSETKLNSLAWWDSWFDSAVKRLTAGHSFGRVAKVAAYSEERAAEPPDEETAEA